MELNDPFEFLGADMSAQNSRDALIRAKIALSQTNGLLCFSESWINPVLWSHYADKHKGICLGFDFPNHGELTKVDYVESRFPFPRNPDIAFMKKLLYSKFTHWLYENEYRAFVQLDTQTDGLYYVNFSENLVLRQVIVGCHSKVTRAQISEAIGDLNDKVEVFKVRAAFKSFEIERDNDNSLWA